MTRSLIMVKYHDTLVKLQFLKHLLFLFWYPNRGLLQWMKVNYLAWVFWYYRLVSIARDAQQWDTIFRFGWLFCCLGTKLHLVSQTSSRFSFANVTFNLSFIITYTSGLRFQDSYKFFFHLNPISVTWKFATLFECF